MSCASHALSLFFKRGARYLSNAEVTALVECRGILGYRLEAVLESPERGVAIRREMLSPKLPDSSALEKLPYRHYDYSKVLLMIDCELLWRSRVTCVMMRCLNVVSSFSGDWH